MDMFKKWIVPILFVIGIMVFSYPIISNWISTKEHHTVISNHNEQLKQMTEAEKAAEQERVKEHNNALKEDAMPITDPFAEDAGNDDEQAGYYNVLNIGETMGSIEIPSLNVDLPIYHGVGDDVLQQGIGHMSNSSFPIGGLGTHTALTGHRGLPSSKLFRDLDKVKKDDVFYIHTLDETIAYKVDDIQIVLPSETEWLEMEDDKDYVTLITCEPYMINTHRLLVRGERTPYHPETMPVSKESTKASEFFPSYLFGMAFLAIMWLLITYRRKKSKMEV